MPGIKEKQVPLADEVVSPEEQLGCLVGDFMRWLLWLLEPETKVYARYTRVEESCHLPPGSLREAEAGAH